jgi:hypothetical protein
MVIADKRTGNGLSEQPDWSHNRYQKNTIKSEGRAGIRSKSPQSTPQLCISVTTRRDNK